MAGADSRQGEGVVQRLSCESYLPLKCVLTRNDAVGEMQSLSRKLLGRVSNSHPHWLITIWQNKVRLAACG